MPANPAVALDAARYTELAKQGTRVDTTTFRLGQPDLFLQVATQAIPPGEGPPASS